MKGPSILRARHNLEQHANARTKTRTWLGRFLLYSLNPPSLPLLVETRRRAFPLSPDQALRQVVCCPNRPPYPIPYPARLRALA